VNFSPKQTLAVLTHMTIKSIAVLCWMLVICCMTNHAWALELNLATEAELDGLKGMGPSLSRKVLAARNIQAFSSWADFRQRVSGIGAAKAKQFSEQGLTVQGHPFSSAGHVSN
jgi:competence protein ComEA